VAPYSGLSLSYSSGDVGFSYYGGTTWYGGYPRTYYAPTYYYPRYYGPYVYTYPRYYYPTYVVRPNVYYDYRRDYTPATGGYGYVRPRYPAPDDAVHGAIGVDRALGPPSNAWLVPSNAGPDAEPERLDGLTPPPFAPEQRTVVVRPSENDPAPAPALPESGANMALLKKVYGYGNASRTEAAFRSELSANPNDAQVYYAYAWTFFVHGKYFPATLVLRRGLALDRSLAADKSVLDGFYDARTASISMNELNAQLTAKPNDADVRMLRAWIYLMEGRRDAARDDLNVVLRQRADDAEVKWLLQAAEK
jgi:tetratricopeptide (TPR) repeat protein